MRQDRDRERIPDPMEGSLFEIGIPRDARPGHPTEVNSNALDPATEEGSRPGPDLARGTQPPAFRSGRLILSSVRLPGPSGRERRADGFARIEVTSDCGARSGSRWQNATG